MIGGNGSSRSDGAWRQVYRALEHGNAKSRCNNSGMIKKFPKQIEDFANLFVQMQVKRHSADYDPFEIFVKSVVENDIDQVEQAIKDFNLAPKSDRLAFCAYVLLRERNT